MLKSIDPLLNADILYALRAMGHGDEIVVCDLNFPAESVARTTTIGRVLRIDGVPCPRTVEAILSVLPIDGFVPDPILRMEVVDSPFEVPDVQAEVQGVVDKAEGRSLEMAGIERFAFYERAKKAFAVVQAGERRFYGCFIIKKGVIPPG